MKSSQATEYFYELTPERIHEACYQAGLRIRPGVTFLNSLENRVVRLEDEDGERWVAKFYRPGRWSRATILEEHDFLGELFDEGLPVVPPIELDDSGETLGEIAGIHYCIFPHYQGRSPDEMTPPLAYQVGAVLGRIHSVGLDRNFRYRPRLGPEEWGLKALNILEKEAVVPTTMWPRYSQTVRRLLSLVEKQFAKFPGQRLHGDLHRGNLLVTSQGLEVVDFDDCSQGPAVQDMWLLIPGKDSDSIEMRELMLEGYQTTLPFDRRQLGLIEPLRALKFVHYAAWVTRRRKDPAFQRLFPDVASYGFWRRELDDLQAQLDLLPES